MTTTITSRIDSKTAKELKQFAKDLGLTMNGYVSAVLTQSLRDRRVVLSDTPVPNDELAGLVKVAEADYNAGRNITNVKDSRDLEKYLAKF